MLGRSYPTPFPPEPFQSKTAKPVPTRPPRSLKKRHLSGNFRQARKDPKPQMSLLWKKNLILGSIFCLFLLIPRPPEPLVWRVCSRLGSGLFAERVKTDVKPCILETGSFISAKVASPLLMYIFAVLTADHLPWIRSRSKEPCLANQNVAPPLLRLYGLKSKEERPTLST